VTGRSAPVLTPGPGPAPGLVPPGDPRRGAGPSGRAILAHAVIDSVRKLGPRAQFRNPVIFIVLAGTVVTLAESVAHPSVFSWSVTCWLALTVLLANFAEAVAEGRSEQAGGAGREKAPGEAALTRLLTAVTIALVPVGIALGQFAHFAGAPAAVVLIALVVCLIPTTIGALLPAIGIGARDRLARRDVLAMSGRAVEAAGDVQTLLLDMTGAVTLRPIAMTPGIRERFARLRAAGIRTVIATGDDLVTAAAIAQEAGADGYLAEATPGAKLALVRAEQQAGKRVAMIGDGTSAAAALAQADVGVVMTNGTLADRDAGTMAVPGSIPARLIDIAETGRQIRITRDALTIFSFASDVAKCLAIVPVLFAAAGPQPGAAGILELHSPATAVLSAVIFNALAIVALLPLALRGVRFRLSGAAAILCRTAIVFGAGGIIVSLAVIKMIDLILAATGAF